MKLIAKPLRRAAWRKFSTWGLVFGLTGLAVIVLWPYIPDAFRAAASPQLLTWIANGSLVGVVWGLIGVFVDQPKLRANMVDLAVQEIQRRSRP